MTTVFVVDDHEVVRRGLIDLIDDEPDLKVTGQAGSMADALTRVPLVQPDVAVLDVRLPDGDGIELCRRLRELVPGLPCLMLTSYADDDAMVEAVRAGAAGFVLKQVLGSDLLDAIRMVAAGRTLLNARTAAAVADRRRVEAEHRDRLAVLSDQERVVFDLIGEGLSNRQIGEQMSLAEKTVKNYVSHVLAKLDLDRRTQIAVLATELRARRPE